MEKLALVVFWVRVAMWAAVVLGLVLLVLCVEHLRLVWI